MGRIVVGKVLGGPFIWVIVWKERSALGQVMFDGEGGTSAGSAGSC